METLEELLAEEAEAYRPQAALLRLFAANVRGLDKYSLDDLEIKIHLDACRHFYEEFGTINGTYTPWILGRQQSDEKE